MADTKGTGCTKLLGITSSGSRVVCGKPVCGTWTTYCTGHEDCNTPAMISFDLDTQSAERIIARAEAYGITVGVLLGRLVRAGLLLNLDSPQ